MINFNNQYYTFWVIYSILDIFYKLGPTLKNGPFLASFSLFSSFQKQLTVNN